jgi:hypothetical protein
MEIHLELLLRVPGERLTEIQLDRENKESFIANQDPA